jgi:AraC-like DNA-binding protein
MSDAHGSIVAAHRANDRRPTSKTPVTHSHAALSFFTGGKAKIDVNGEWTLEPGDVLLVPAAQPHRMIERTDPSFWAVGFCVSCFAAEGAAALLEPFERVRDGASAVVRIPVERRTFMESLFRELEAVGEEAHTDAQRLDAVRRSLLTLILNEVERASRGSAPGARSSRSGVVVDALRFIERNCLRRLTLADVSAAVGRTPAHVTSALTKATGRSAVEWIVSGRMAEARRLLLHSDEMVDVIAERVGYADATHFIRMFRREHGVTPAQWRAARVGR